MKTIIRSMCLFLLLSALASAASGQRLVTSVPLPAKPLAFAVSPITNRIYVACDDGQLYFIDGVTLSIFGQMDIASRDPMTMLALDPISDGKDDILYAWIYLQSKVWRIYPQTRRTDPLGVPSLPMRGLVAGKLPWALLNDGTNNCSVDSPGTSGNRVSGFGIGTALAINAANQAVYAADNSLLVYDTAGHRTDRGNVDGLTQSFVTVNPVTGRVYVTAEGTSDELSVNDRVTVLGGLETGNQRLASLSVASTGGGILANSTTNRIYAWDERGTMTEIDGATNSRRIVTRNRFVANHFTMNQRTNLLYGWTALTPGGPSVLAEVHPQGTVALMATPFDISMPGPIVNMFTNRVYAISRAGNALMVFDGSTARIIRKLKPTGVSRISAVSVDASRDEAYVAYRSGHVAAIDRDGNSFTYVTTGTPIALATNPVAHKTYSINGSAFASQRGTVDIFLRPGTTIARTVTVGFNPVAAAVNPVTERAYILNAGSPTFAPTVSVLDRSDTVMATVGTGLNPTAIAVDPRMNYIYVANGGANSLTVIDGETNTVRYTVPVGKSPAAMALNRRTNVLYVANAGGSDVSAYHPGTVPRTLTVGRGPAFLAVNENTDTFYVASTGDKDLRLIRDYSVLKTIRLGATPTALAVDEASNRIIVALHDAGKQQIAIIDGTTDQISLYPAGTSPDRLAVSPPSGTVWLTDLGTDEIDLIKLSEDKDPLPRAFIPQRFPGDATSDARPTFFVAVQGRGFTVPQIYYQLDRFDGPWLRAQLFSGTFQTPLLATGQHTLYYAAADAEAAAVQSPRGAWSPRMGNVQSYTFNVTCSGITPSPRTLNVPATASAQAVTVTTDCAWNVRSNVPWISVVDESWLGSGTVGLNISANPNGPRSGTVSIGGQLVTVNQQ